MSNEINSEAIDALDYEFDRIDELLSLFLDDALEDAEAAELNALLQNDPEARNRCCDAAQLHADLTALFGGTPKVEFPPIVAPITPVATPTGESPAI